MSIADKLTTIAENQQKVYDAGKQAEYDAFWDKFQRNGNRTSYSYAFTGEGWYDEIFKPKYDLTKATELTYTFYNCPWITKIPINIASPNAYNYNYMFCNATHLKEIPKINLSKVTVNTQGMFSGCQRLESIEEIYIKETVKLRTNTFQNCVALKEIRFSGTIAQGIYIQSAPLSVESMKSIISCLKNHTGTDNEGSYTLSFSSGCWDTLEASGTAPNGGTWKDYVGTLGWLT